ncbi:MAG TPA: hypothetical protein VEH62_05330 [Gemmatimonadales bacterium]|nr:hypothetical protein [Gemmatimonadales bacterium]
MRCRTSVTRHFLVVAAASLAASCVSLTDDHGGSATVNVPVVGQTAQALGFSVQARGFSFEQRYGSPTQGDSLALGLAVVGYTGGSALIEVTDSSGTMRLQQTVTTSLAQGSTVIHGRPPYQVHLLFDAFSGAFTLAVAAQS